MTVHTGEKLHDVTGSTNYHAVIEKDSCYNEMPKKGTVTWQGINTIPHCSGDQDTHDEGADRLPCGEARLLTDSVLCMAKGTVSDKRGP